MRRKSLPANTQSDQALDDPIRYRIDPEIAHSLLSVRDPNLALRQADFWDSVGAEYADIARNLGYRVAIVRAERGDKAADAYLEAATSILEAINRQDDLEEQLAASS